MKELLFSFNSWFKVVVIVAGNLVYSPDSIQARDCQVPTLLNNLIDFENYFWKLQVKTNKKYRYISQREDTKEVQGENSRISQVGKVALVPISKVTWLKKLITLGNILNLGVSNYERIFQLHFLKYINIHINDSLLQLKSSLQKIQIILSMQMKVVSSGV